MTSDLPPHNLRTPPVTDAAAIIAKLDEQSRMIAALTMDVHRLSVAHAQVTAAGKAAGLSVVEAAKRLRRGVKSIRRLIAARAFTDGRAVKKSGSPWTILADEIDTLRVEGEDGLRLYRRRMGRL